MMTGKDIRMAAQHISDIKNLIYGDSEKKDIEDYSCYEGSAIMPEFNGDDPRFDLYDYNEKIAEAFVINHIDVISMHCPIAGLDIKDLTDSISDDGIGDDRVINAIELFIKKTEEFIDKLKVC